MLSPPGVFQILGNGGHAETHVLISYSNIERMFECVYCGRIVKGEMPPMSHDECSKEYDRRQAAGLCVYCGLAVKKESAKNDWPWHDKCHTREEFSRY